MYKLPTKQKEHNNKVPTTYLRDATSSCNSISRLAQKSQLKAKGKELVCEDPQGSLSNCAYSNPSNSTYSNASHLAHSKAVGKASRGRVDTEESEEEFISFLAGFEKEIVQLTKRNLGTEYPR
jgi:hypothetical protein